MLVTVAGMLTLVRFTQLTKACVGIAVSPSPRVAVSSAAQPEKTLLPILFTDVMVTVFIVALPLKADS